MTIYVGTLTKEATVLIVSDIRLRIFFEGLRRPYEIGAEGFMYERSNFLLGWMVMGQ